MGQHETGNAARAFFAGCSCHPGQEQIGEGAAPLDEHVTQDHVIGCLRDSRASLTWTLTPAGMFEYGNSILSAIRWG